MSDPTVVCVVGMHRSGTSLVARALHVLGVDLGPEEHLMPPSTANPAGHWEHVPIQELNDEILLRLGGTWSQPPELAPGWEDEPVLDELRYQARDVIETDFSQSERWGFKDPRASLTLPFWQRIVPPMRYVICLRNPVDVAYSLRARQDEPLPFEHGVELWLTYLRAALSATAAHPLKILFYEDLMADPAPAIRELADFLGNDRSDVAEAFTQAAIRVAVSETLWHHRTPFPNVIDEPRLPFHVKAVYMALRLFAAGPDSVGLEALELLGDYAADAERQRADLERRVSERRVDLEQLMQSRREEHERLEELSAELGSTRAELEDARAEVTRLRTAARVPAPQPKMSGENASDEQYDRLVDDVRARAVEVIPADGTVLVASKGDEKLLRLDGRVAWHFPIGADGRYVGYHPAGDTAAIAQLEAMRARGADHLMLPATMLWWLDHYPGLRRHLDARYTPLLRDESCVIYQLRDARRAADGSPIATLKHAAACLRISLGHSPSVLDWRTDLGAAEQLPEIPVFVPPREIEVLPYLDRSIDIVLLASADASRVAQARRVASGAIIRLDPEAPDRAELEWLPGASSGWGEDVSVVLFPDPAEISAWSATLKAVGETLGDGFAGQLAVVGSSDVLESTTESVGTADIQVRQIETGPESTLAARAGAAVRAGPHGYQMFIAAPAVPLPGWLPSILNVFSHRQGTGVVGTRILSRFGALEEAGGIVSADGSQRHRGEGDEDPDRPEYSFVKRVDFCSPPLLATRQDLFERLKGFDAADSTSPDALVDFSLRAGRAGSPVYYQPGARMVRIGEVGS